MKRIITALAIVIAASFMLLSCQTAVAKYIDTGDIKVRNVSEVKNATTFEKVEELHRSSYFEENGFRWYNGGQLSKEKFENATTSFDWTQGFTGWQDGTPNKMCWSEVADPTTGDHKSIAIKAGKLQDDGSFGTVGGFIAKNSLAMHKTYPAFVALPTEDYWFNQTVKLPMGAWDKKTEGIIPVDNWEIRLPMLTTMICTLQPERMLEFIDNPDTPLPVRALGISLARTPKDNPNINNEADWENKLIKLVVFEFEQQPGQTYQIETTEWTLDWLNATESWLYVNTHFVKVGGIWYLRITIKDSGSQIEGPNVPDVILAQNTYDAELKIFTLQENINLFHCWFSSYVYKHEVLLGMQTWIAENGVWGQILGIIVACAIMFVGAFLANPAIIAVGVGLFIISVVMLQVAVNVLNYLETMVEALQSGRAAIEDLINIIFRGKPNPPENFISYIDKVTVETGNIPPEARLAGEPHFDTINVTQPDLVGRTHPFIPYDWFECAGNNSIDSDGTIASTRFYFGLVEEGKNTTHSIVIALTAGVTEFSGSGTGELALNPKSYTTYTTGADPDNLTNTYKRWEPLKIDMKNVVFDDDDGFDLGYGDPLKFPMMFDGGRVWKNGTIEIIWKELFARIDHQMVQAGNLVPVNFSAEYSQYRSSRDADYEFITDDIEELWGITYTWDFGDGSQTTGKQVSHKFVPGVYTVKLTLSDKDGHTDVAYCNVFIYEEVAPPTPPGWLEEYPWLWWIIGGLVGAGIVVGIIAYAKPSVLSEVYVEPKTKRGKKT